MSSQPVTWAGASLLDCAQFIRGVTYTKGDAREHANVGLIPIFRANNIQSGKFDLTDLVYVPENLTSPDQVLRPGDVVIATSSGSISVVGKAAQVLHPQHASFGAFCGVLRPSPAVHAKYFGHFFSSKTYRDAVSDMARGVNINNLKRDHFQAINIPLAPLPEQQRIADKLDTVLARVDAVNDRLARVAPLLKRFRQAVLAAATSGRLTADWREARATADVKAALTELAQIFAAQEKSAPYLASDRPAPFLANKQSLKDIGVVSGGLTKNAKRAELALVKPYLRVANVHANELRLNDIASIGLTEAEFAKTCLQTNDLLIVEGNGSLDQIGRVALWDGSISECSHQNHLIRWRANQGIDPKYVLYWLLSPEGRTQIELVAKSTTGLHTLSVSKVSALTLPVPGQEEQSEIVRRVDILFAFADRLEARLQAAQIAASRLTPVLLAKAFRGELVPQDPADEPAAELLKRLAASQASATPPRQGRRPARA